MIPLYIEALIDMGHEVSLFEIRTDDYNSSSLIYQIRTSWKVASGFGTNPSAFLDSHEPDLIIVQNLFPNISVEWMRRRNEPIISFIHNFRHFCAAATFFRAGKMCFSCIERSPIVGLCYGCYRDSKLATLPLTLRQLIPATRRIELTGPTFFITLSEMASSQLELAGISRNKIRVLTNYVPDTIPLELSSKPNSKWLFVGRLTLEKGILDLLEHWPDAHFLDVYGSGPLEKQVSTVAAGRPNIRFLGSIDNEVLLKMMPSYFGAVFPSKWIEGIPTTALEYMRSGLPLIGLKGTAIADLLESEQGGVILDHFSNEVLLGAIDFIHHNHAKLKSNAREIYLRHFSKEVWQRSFASIIQEIEMVQD